MLIRHHHPDAATLARACGSTLAGAVRLAHAEGRAAWLALAGGRTAPPILAAMAAALPAHAPVDVVSTDERWVPAGHADHNLTALARALDGVPGVRLHDLVPDGLKTWPTEPQPAAAAALLAPLHQQRFDAVLLGMGADGHFASLFAGASNLAAALDLDQDDDVLALRPDPMPTAGPWPRLSLTLARLLRTRQLLLAITGTEKAMVLERALVGDHSLPVHALLQQSRIPVQLHWAP